jgi:hypothetical protein
LSIGGEAGLETLFEMVGEMTLEVRKLGEKLRQKLNPEKLEWMRSGIDRNLGGGSRSLLWFLLSPGLGLKNVVHIRGRSRREPEIGNWMRWRIRRRVGRSSFRFPAHGRRLKKLDQVITFSVELFLCG